MKLRRWFAGGSGLGFTFWVTYWLPSLPFNAVSHVLGSDALLEAVTAPDALPGLWLAFVGFWFVSHFAMLAYVAASAVACWRAATRATIYWGTAAKIYVGFGWVVWVASVGYLVGLVPE